MAMCLVPDKVGNTLKWWYTNKTEMLINYEKKIKKIYI